MLQVGRSQVQFIQLIFEPHYGPGVDSASNTNEYQEFSWGYRPAGRPAHTADKLTAICKLTV
jgi:hypothetical protein